MLDPKRIAAVLLILALAAGVPQGVGAGLPDKPDITDPVGDAQNLTSAGDFPDQVASAQAVDIKAAWVDYNTAFAANSVGDAWNQYFLTVIEVPGLDEAARNGAVMEDATWVFHFAVGGDNYTLALQDNRPCIGTFCPAFGQGTVTAEQVCKNGESISGDLTPQQAKFGYSTDDPWIMMGVKKGVVGSPDAGEKIGFVSAEVRKITDQEGVSCPVEGGTLVDRAPDHGNVLCLASKAGCFPPAPTPPPEVPPAIEVGTPSTAVEVQEPVDGDRQATVPLTITNEGRFQEVVQLDVTGPDGWQVDVAEPRFPLDGSAEQTTEAHVTPPDSAEPGDVATFDIHAETDRGTEDDGSFSVRVVERPPPSEYRPFTVEVDTPAIDVLPGDTGRLTVSIDNNADEELVFEIELDADEPDWATLDVPDPDHFVVQAGQTRLVHVTVSPPADTALGTSADFELEITGPDGASHEAEMSVTAADTTQAAPASDPAGAALSTMGLGSLASSGIYGVLLLVLVVLVVLLLILALLGRDKKKTIEIEEVQED